MRCWLLGERRHSMINFTIFDLYDGATATFYEMVVRTDTIVSLTERNHNFGRMSYNKVHWEVARLTLSTGAEHDVLVKDNLNFTSPEIVRHYLLAINNNEFMNENNKQNSK